MEVEDLSGSDRDEAGTTTAGRGDFQVRAHYIVFISVMLLVVAVVTVALTASATSVSDGSLGVPPLCPGWTCDPIAHCVNVTSLCDDVPDCEDGSDEGEICDTNRQLILKDTFKKRPDADHENHTDECLMEDVPEQCTCTDRTQVKCRIPGPAQVAPELPNGATSIDLSDCTLSVIPIGWISYMPDLNYIIISRSTVRKIAPLAIRGCSNLYQVIISYCQLDHFSTNMFSSDNKVEELNLSGNKLTVLRKNDFKHMAYLKELWLPENKIRSIEPDVFQSMPNLTVLDLRDNQLSQITVTMFQHLTKLRRLYLTNNFIASIAPSAFQPLPSLIILQLNGNALSEIEEDSFNGLTHLQLLDLSSNPFRKLINGTFKNLRELDYIHFDRFYMCLYAVHVKRCEATRDGISSENNLLESIILRVCVWVVALLACVGNIFVILGRFLLKEDNQIHSFFIKNLSAADLLMGVYLLIIGVYDCKFRGKYIIYDESWRNSWQCDLSGVLSTLSTEMSVLTLCVITLDRYLSIKYPLSFRKRELKIAYLAMAFTWAICIVLASLPVMRLNYFGKTFYRDNAVCTPLHLHEPTAKGWEYSSFLFLGINLGSFGFIAYAYVSMFYSIHMSALPLRTSRESKERCLVKRFFFIVLTDFLCWVPIIVIKILALSGVRITVDLYAWVIVFVLPVNSALNPLLYTLTTKLFKRKLLSKFTSVVFRPNNNRTDSSHSRSSIKVNTSLTRNIQECEMDILRRYEATSRANNPKGSPYPSEPGPRTPRQFAHSRPLHHRSNTELENGEVSRLIVSTSSDGL